MTKFHWKRPSQLATIDFLASLILNRNRSISVRRRERSRDSVTYPPHIAFCLERQLARGSPAWATVIRAKQAVVAYRSTVSDHTADARGMIYCFIKKMPMCQVLGCCQYFNFTSKSSNWRNISILNWYLSTILPYHDPECYNTQPHYAVCIGLLVVVTGAAAVPSWRWRFFRGSSYMYTVVFYHRQTHFSTVSDNKRGNNSDIDRLISDCSHSEVEKTIADCDSTWQQQT